MADQPLVDIPIQSSTNPVPAPPVVPKTAPNGAILPTDKPNVSSPKATPVTSTKVDPNPVVATPPVPKPPALPSSQQMLQDLQQAGTIQTSGQPGQPATPATPASPSTPTQPSPPTSPTADTQSTVDLEDLSRWSRPVFKYFRLLVAVALTLQGLYGIFKSVRFILIEYPELETLLVSNMISQEQVTGLATKALITLATTILGLVFAMRIMRSKAGKVLNTVIGVLLFFFGAYLNSYVSQNFDVINLITNPIISFFRLIGVARDTVSETTQQLPIDTKEVPTLIWEQ